MGSIRLDRKITVERKAEGSDAFGGASGHWESVGVAWAGFRPMPDADRLKAGRNEVRAAGWITLRWRLIFDNLRGTHSIVMDGWRWEIAGFREIRHRCWLEFFVERID